MWRCYGDCLGGTFLPGWYCLEYHPVGGGSTREILHKGVFHGKNSQEFFLREQLSTGDICGEIFPRRRGFPAEFKNNRKLKSFSSESELFK